MFAALGGGLTQPMIPCAVFCSVASFLTPTLHSGVTEEQFKSLGDAYIFMQPNSKAILFLMNLEITLIPPVLYPCCIFGGSKAIQAHVH